MSSATGDAMRRKNPALYGAHKWDMNVRGDGLAAVRELTDMGFRIPMGAYLAVEHAVKSGATVSVFTSSLPNYGAVPNEPDEAHVIVMNTDEATDKLLKAAGFLRSKRIFEEYLWKSPPFERVRVRRNPTKDETMKRQANPHTSHRGERFIERVSRSENGRVLEWVDTSATRDYLTNPKWLAATGWALIYGKHRNFGGKNSFLFHRRHFVKLPRREWSGSYNGRPFINGRYDPTTKKITFDDGSPVGGLPMQEYLILSQMLERAATPGRLRPPEPRSNPVRTGRVRRNGAALAAVERTAVEDSRNSTSAVTVRKYGGRQWYGLYEYIPVRGRGFEMSFSFHEDEAVPRVERDDLNKLDAANARRMERLAKEAVFGR